MDAFYTNKFTRKEYARSDNARGMYKGCGKFFCKESLNFDLNLKF